MAQNWPIVSVSQSVASSISEFAERDESIKSCFSGIAYPTTTLTLGMLCYRTDQQKLYQLQSMVPNWVLIADLSKVIISLEDAEADYHKKSMVSATPPVDPSEGQIWFDSSVDPWSVNVRKEAAWVKFNTLAAIQGPQGDVGPDGDQGDIGPQGPDGEQGTQGPRGTHEWAGTSLSIQNPDLTDGEYVDLKGDTGPQGGKHNCYNCNTCGTCNACYTCTCTCNCTCANR